MTRIGHAAFSMGVQLGLPRPRTPIRVETGASKQRLSARSPALDILGVRRHASGLLLQVVVQVVIALTYFSKGQALAEAGNASSPGKV